MSNLKRQKNLCTLFVFFFTFACSKPTTDNKSEPVSSPAPVANPAAPVSSETSIETNIALKDETPKPVKKEVDALASLEKLSNRADTRIANETIWKAAAPGQKFLKHDALQTHEKATASVKYKSGSRLSLSENTFIIFEKDPGVKAPDKDEVFLNRGELTGTTEKELWVFTQAGLVQLKPTKQKKVASALLKITQKNKISIAVKDGQAEVFVKKSMTELKKYQIAENAEVEIVASIPLITSENEISPSQVIKVVEQMNTVAKPTLAELDVSSLADNATIAEKELPVKGRLTEQGAKLLVNGDIVEINGDLTFQKNVNLTPGTNIIVFQLVRSDGSVKFYRKSVRHNSP